MPVKRVTIGGAVRVNAYAVISDAVSVAVAMGIRRAHKHENHPSEELLAERIEDAVMAALGEVLHFDGPAHDD